MHTAAVAAWCPHGSGQPKSRAAQGLRHSRTPAAAAQHRSLVCLPAVVGKTLCGKHFVSWLLR